MGLDLKNLEMLLYCKQKNIKFGKVLTLGRQENLIDKNFLQSKNPKLYNSLANINEKYADKIIIELGAKKVYSIDKSTYEKASLTHDLNAMPPKKIHNKFDLVLDFGTLEHTFHYTMALKHAMMCIKRGGHFLCSTPANNCCGHGFWQTSPELFFAVFCEKNGFKLKQLFITETNPFSSWYSYNLKTLPNSLTTRWKCPANSVSPFYVMALAQRVSIKKIFNTVPQQQCYIQMWKKRKIKFFQKQERNSIFRKIKTICINIKIYKTLFQAKQKVLDLKSIIFFWLAKPSKNQIYLREIGQELKTK